MLVSGYNTERFNEALVRLNRELENLGRLNLLSQAVHAEDLYMRLLNALYGWELANANESERNAEAVDLVDEAGKRFVQVTIECAGKKVSKTLRNPVTKDYADRGYRVMLVFVGHQWDYIKKSKAVKNELGIPFDQERDLLLTSDLVERFIHLDPQTQATALRVLDGSTGTFEGSSGYVDPAAIKRINERLYQRRATHPSFRLMGDISLGLLPKGVGTIIPNSDRSVELERGESLSFGEFIRDSWDAQEQCHLLITGEGGVGKTVALLTLATEDDFLPRRVAAVYVPLHELSQYCGEGADRDCVDRFIDRDTPVEHALDAVKCLATQPWRQGPSLILLLDGYNEIPYGMRAAVSEGVKKWASWPGVQVITTSREVGSFGIPHMRRLVLRPLEDEAVKRFLGDNAPQDGDAIWQVIRTPLMLRLYVGASALEGAGADYVRIAPADSAGHLVWNYLQRELWKCVEQSGGGFPKAEYGAALLLTLPLVCWRMEASHKLKIPKAELRMYVREACRRWHARYKPAYFEDVEEDLLSHYDDCEARKTPSQQFAILSKEVGLLAWDGDDGYSLLHQSLRDGLAAVHLKNTMESPCESLPEEFSHPVSEHVKDFLVDICEQGPLMDLWNANGRLSATDETATYNILRVIHKARDGDLSELDWSGMDLRDISLFSFRSGTTARLSEKADRFRSTLLGADCFRPQGHAGAVRSVCFSPDGSLIASGSVDGTVRLWDPTTGRQVLKPMRGSASVVASVAFSPDGLSLASGSGDGSVCLWSLDGRRGRPLTGSHEGVVNSVCFSPDGSLLASASSDGSIRLWEAKTGRGVVMTIRARGSFLSLCFSPDGRLLASGSNDRSVRLWDPMAGREVGRPLRARGGGVWSVCFSPDGSLLASAHGDGSVRLWDVASRRGVGDPLRTRGGRVSAVSFSPDGRMLASGSKDGAVRLWDSATGCQIGEPLRQAWGQTNAVSFSPDGRALASGSGDGAVRLWDPASGRIVREPFWRLGKWANSLCFSPDGRVLASGSSDGVVRLWDPRTGLGLRKMIDARGGRVWSICFAPERGSGLLAFGSDDGTVRLWDAATGRSVGDPLRGSGGRVLSVCFSPDGRLIASATVHGAVDLWDSKDCRRVGGPLLAAGGAAWSVCFSPDGSRLATGSKLGMVELWDPKTCQRVGEPLFSFGGRARSVCFSPDGQRLACGMDNGTVRLWSLLPGRPTSIQLDGHKDKVVNVCFSPDGTLLASGSSEGTMRLWDTRNGRQVGPTIPNAGWGVCFSPDGTLLASSFTDGNIRLWDTQAVESAHPRRSAEPAMTIEPLHGISLHGLDFSEAIIGSDHDKEVLRQNGVIV